MCRRRRRRCVGRGVSGVEDVVTIDFGAGRACGEVYLVGLSDSSGMGELDAGSRSRRVLPVRSVEWMGSLTSTEH